MPRVADHDARRRQIAGAVHALATRFGLDAVTVARTAAEAGCSVGLVQHYFPSKDDLLVCTYEQALGEIEGRVAAHIATGESRQQSIAQVVLASLTELLPLDDKRRGEYRVVRAFTGRAADQPRLAEVAAATSSRIRNTLATAVTNGKECGEVEQEADAAQAAVRVLAVTEGLATQLFLEPRADIGGRPMRDVAEDAVRATLASVFTGECRQYRK